ncbi:MAG: hypothetical protein DMF79_06110 [Acidobacteria bacterium]|nr:MAG: hypothetical protein DMF79_06110 [Acidobacteriota bacterium]
MTDLKGELASLKIDRTPPASSPWRWPLLLFVPVILFLGVLYAFRARQALSAPEVETVRAAVSRDVEASAGTPILTASGYVVARRKAVVSAKIQGRLSDLRVEEGSVVREGEVIARLESTDYEAQVKRARAAVQRAEADLAENQRQLQLAEKLTKDNVVSVDQRDAAASRVRIAEAALEQARADAAFAEAQLQNTFIRAPFSGVVVKKMAEIGESVAPIPPGVNISTSSGAIVALADLATLEVEADVAESKLRQVIPTADRTKATVQVKVTILDKDKDLKPEMSAKVTFLEPEKKSEARAPGTPVITVPKAAITTRDGKPVVFQVREGKVRARPVVTGGERQDQVVIREGLAGGETIVARPPENLKDGDGVRVKG